MVMMLIFVSAFIIFLKKVARAQNTFEVGGSVSVTSDDWTCAHSPYTATYTFYNYINRESSELPLEGNEIYKCEPVSASLSPSGIWAGRLVYSPSSSPGSTWGGTPGACACCACCACGCACAPPADIIDCSSLDDCLSHPEANLYSLDSSGQGKGVIKQPVLADLTAESVSPYYNCSGNQCVAYAGRNYTFSEKVNATKYYGRCQDGVATIDCPVLFDPLVCYMDAEGNPKKDLYSPVIDVEGNISEIKNVVKYQVTNRPPSVTTTFSETEALPEQEVNITCHAVDPDCAGDPEHMDKISRIEWSCVDAQGDNTGCYFKKGDVWHTGTLTEDLTGVSEVTNDYETTVSFKGSDAQKYAVTCEAQDSDPVSPVSAEGMAEIDLNAPESEGIQYCKIMHENDLNDRIVCVGSDSGPVSVDYKAFLFGIDPGVYETYSWKCSESDVPDESDQSTKQCTYNYDGGGGSFENEYIPSLSMVDKNVDPDEVVACNSTISTKVTNIAKSSVKVKQSGTSDDYVDKISIVRGSEVSGIILNQCLISGTTIWDVSGASILNSNNLTIDVKLDDPSSVQAKINAKVWVDKNQDGNIDPDEITESSGAVINIKDKMQWGN